ncbi:MAG: Fe-S cluster assembly protein SufB [Elusimicrobia bacterium]|nr:MAG: Fe-S cluster assembly protein SufB [Elusimicrobiota bacterium]
MTLLVVGEGASLQYVEGCLAPVAAGNPPRVLDVEIRAMKDSRVRVTTLENRTRDAVRSLKRVSVAEGAFVEWVDAALGPESAVAEPVVTLAGPGARAEVHRAVLSGGVGVVSQTVYSEQGTKVSRLAEATAVKGFLKRLPLEYAVEFDRQVELELEGASHGL